MSFELFRSNFGLSLPKVLSTAITKMNEARTKSYALWNMQEFAILGISTSRILGHIKATRLQIQLVTRFFHYNCTEFVFHGE